MPFVVLATIGAPHGVRGEVRVKSFTSDPLALGTYGPLSARDGRAFAIERVRPAKGVVIAKFRGVDDRDTAEALNGLDLGVDRSALPPAEEDEFYHADLIGLAASDAEGRGVGTVIAVRNFGAGDILEIAPPHGATILIPFTKAAVPDIDLSSGRLVVAPPEEVDLTEEEP